MLAGGAVLAGGAARGSAVATGALVLTVALAPDRLEDEPERLAGQCGPLKDERRVKAHHGTLPPASVTPLRL